MHPPSCRLFNSTDGIDQRANLPVVSGACSIRSTEWAFKHTRISTVFSPAWGDLSPQAHNPGPVTSRAMEDVCDPTTPTVIQSLVLRAGDIKWNPGPQLRCRTCEGAVSTRELKCITCGSSYHRSCSGLTKSAAAKQYDDNTFVCNECDPASNLQHLCKICEKGIRRTQNRATCQVCQSLANLACTKLSRLDRERLKNGGITWKCCSQPIPHPQTTPETRENEDC